MPANPMYVKLKKGRLFWHWVLRANNGEIVSTSETFFSRSNALRGAGRFCELTNIPLEEV